MTVSETDPQLLPDLSGRGDVVWNGIHRDGHNSDFSPHEVSPDLRPGWTALDGSAILFGPAIGPENRRYISSGRGDGSPHLHCFSPQGDLLHQSEPELGQPSSRVSPDVPLFDDQGRFFVCDDDALWCFDANISLVWRTNLSQFGAKRGFISTIIAKGGLVGGVTMDGEVILVDRDTGRLARPVLRLSSGEPLAMRHRMPGLWDNGLMDPDLIPKIEPGFFGFGFAVTCSPAVHAQTGRIFVPHVGPGGQGSILVAIDDDGASLKVAWGADIPGICTSSPSISLDGRRVHTVNGFGLMHAFSTETGELLWTQHSCGMAASPTIDEKGVVYSAGRDKDDQSSQLVAMDGETGGVLWKKNFDDLACEILPRRAANPAFPKETPTAVANSVPTVTPKHILLVANLGYDFVPPGASAKMQQPHQPVLLVLERSTGKLLNHVRLRDTSEAVIVTGDDGTVHICHAALMSSVFHYGIDPNLPAELRTPLKPIGGFTTLVV